MELSVDVINKAFAKEKVWETGETENFTFGDWELTLRKEEELYLPYTFSVSGERKNSNETWRRRYTSLERAFLHILNNFNENARIENKYKTLSEAIYNDKRLRGEML